MAVRDSVKSLAVIIGGMCFPLFIGWIVFGNDFIVTNNMKSVQPGWWIRTLGDPTYNDVILFDVPSNVQEWIRTKNQDGTYKYPKAVHWLRIGARFLKPVAGIEGDTLCRDEQGNVSINDIDLGRAQFVDNNGIPLPIWSGCHSIGSGEYAVISQTPESLDSRVFGVVKAKDVIGRYVLLWEFE